MSRRFSFYLGILIVSLLVSASLCDIYLSAFASNSWGGDCDSLLCSSSNTPCAVPVGLVDTHTSCNITMLGANYAARPLSLTTAGQTRLTIRVTIQGKVSNLELSLSTDGGTVQIKGLNSAELFESSVDVASTMASKLHIVDLSLKDSRIMTRGPISPISIFNCNWTSVFPSTVLYLEYTDLLLFAYQTNLNVPTFVYSSGLIAVELVGVNGTVETLVSSDTELLKISDSNLTISDRLVNSAKPYFHVEISNSNISKTGRLAMWSPNPPSIVQIRDSIISGFELSYNTSISFERTELNSCAWEIVDNSLAYAYNLTVNIKKFGSGLVFHRRQGQYIPLHLKVNVDPGLEPFQPFLIDPNMKLDNRSTLVTNMVWLSDSGPLAFRYLKVTQLMGGFHGSMRPNITASPNSVWEFNSINLTFVSIDLSNVAKFIYCATQPLQGIITDATTEITTPSNIVLSWPDSQTLSYNYWYPLGSEFTSPPDVFHFENGMPNQEFQHQFTPLDGSISYRFATRHCPPPPVGFICVDGQWIADGSGNTTTVITLPPNSGVVQIQGNLTVVGPIVFDGVGSSLNVSGCVSATEIEIILGDPENTPSEPLVSQGKQCPPLDGTAIHVKQTGTSCKKIEAIRSSSATQLAVIFRVDSSNCSSRSWRWIVLGTVLGLLVVVSVTSVLVWKFMFSKFSTKPMANES